MKELLWTLRNRAPLGWFQLRRDRSRLLVAMSGITFADVLIFMQLGFMNALYDTAVLTHTQLNADIILLSPQAKTLDNSGTFPRRRLYQVMDVPGVQSADALYIGFAEWKHPITRKKTSMLLIGLNPERSGLLIPEVMQQIDRIKLPDTILFDRTTRGDYRTVLAQLDRGKAVTTEIGARTVTIVGHFPLGASFEKDGTIVTSDQNFLSQSPGREASQVSLGLVKIQPGYSLEPVIAAINAQQFPDVVAYSKAGFIQKTKDYMAANQPIGFIFSLGTAVGVFVGAIVVYQILSADVNDHLAEYATFKAIGYRHRYLLGIVFEEALILSIAGFFPGLAVSSGAYVLTRNATALPIVMPMSRIIFVFILTIFMCGVSGAIATRQLGLADPADIF
jgi:putative ABC transport system permease protein